jgi:hypothetical protein
VGGSSSSTLGPLVSTCGRELIFDVRPTRLKILARVTGLLCRSLSKNSCRTSAKTRHRNGRLDEIRLVPTLANRQPALAAYARGEDGRHRPYGLMVLRVEGDLIAGIVGFPDPWLFAQCGLPAELD